MTYLSRIRINPLRAASRTLLANPRALHAAVMGGLPDHTDDERVLWRLDPDNPHRPYLFVLTRSRPDWTHVVEQVGWPDADGEHAAVRDYAPVLAQLAVGREFAFRLTASPVQNTRTPTKPTRTQAERLAAHAEAGNKRPRSFRLGHRTASAQLAWILSQAPRRGFDIPAVHLEAAATGPQPRPPATAPDTAKPRRSRPDTNPPFEVRITARHRHSFRKHEKGHTVVFHSATFEGRLRITDTQLFRSSLLAGIGPSKAYGCGLLTLAPLPEARG
ncbi:type I-E CRISPR-associated protein Cas6/Cse3/CasE [Streptomyces sp. NPDC015131]|uniref:type I-E CRISPR-associated protein Cas6/Cse3/CasE n=1 Tax=Streptomyces sp. NPDC015131 TaxID=3364941 RepID=UPI0036FF1E74